MANQLKHRRDTFANNATFTGGAGEVVMDTTNAILRLHDGAQQAGWPIAMATRTNVADAAYSVLVTDRLIAFTSITAARAVALPTAALYPVGALMIVADESGSASVTNSITINRASTDTINGQTSVVINQPYGSITMECNGANAWTAIAGALPTSLTYAGSLVATTALTLTGSYQSGGVTLPGQILTVGSVWRIKAFGTLAAISSASTRQVTFAAFWGATQLTGMVTGNVLASTVQTSPWMIDIMITGSSTTAAWVNGHVYDHVTTAIASAEIAPLIMMTPTTNTGLSTGPQTIDFKMISSGTVVADVLNVQNVTIERLR